MTDVKRPRVPWMTEDDVLPRWPRWYTPNLVTAVTRAEWEQRTKHISPRPQWQDPVRLSERGK